MAITKPIIQQRIPFVDPRGIISNEGLRALNDAFGALFDQINQIVELYQITAQLNGDVAGLATSSVILHDPSASFPNGRVILGGTAIGFVETPTTLTIVFDGSTDDVTEGLNLYFTTTRARNSVNGSSTVTYNAGTGVFSLTNANVIAALGYTPASPPNGSLTLGIRTITSAPTFAAGDHTLICDATAGAIAVALPAAGTVTGRVLAFKKSDLSANTVTLTPNGAETIDGAASIVIAVQYDSYTIQSDGSKWWVL